MNELEIKEQLERALHTQIRPAEWQDLKDTRLLGEYMRGELSWLEFREVVEEMLGRLRRFLVNLHREEIGELKFTGELESKGEDAAEVPDIPTNLGDRAFARSRALASLNRLRTDGRSSGRSAIYGTLLPRGGTDGTLAQWVYIVAVELWVPAEEVMRNYRKMQRTMLRDPNPPKTQTRAFEVAQFVWEDKLLHGERPPWKTMWERWNNRPLTEPFKNWRDFHRYFDRGAEVTPPRYVATNEQITDLVRSRSHQGVFDVWASKVRE